MAESLFNLAGRSALVTGAARGLGAAMAEALGQAGARLFLNDIDEAALSARCKALTADGVQAEGVVFDVCDAAGVARAMTEIKSRMRPSRYSRQQRRDRDLQGPGGYGA